VTQDGYLLDNAAAAAGPRLDALAQLFDPSLDLATPPMISAWGRRPAER
jgi:hypothetical protein